MFEHWSFENNDIYGLLVLHLIRLLGFYSFVLRAYIKMLSVNFGPWLAMVHYCCCIKVKNGFYMCVHLIDMFRVLFKMSFDRNLVTRYINDNSTENYTFTQNVRNKTSLFYCFPLTHWCAFVNYSLSLYVNSICDTVLSIGWK